MTNPPHGEPPDYRPFAQLIALAIAGGMGTLLIAYSFFERDRHELFGAGMLIGGSILFSAVLICIFLGQRNGR